MFLAVSIGRYRHNRLSMFTQAGVLLESNSYPNADTSTQTNNSVPESSYIILLALEFVFLKNVLLISLKKRYL